MSAHRHPRVFVPLAWAIGAATLSATAAPALADSTPTSTETPSASSTETMGPSTEVPTSTDEATDESTATPSESPTEESGDKDEDSHDGHEHGDDEDGHEHGDEEESDDEKSDDEATKKPGSPQEELLAAGLESSDKVLVGDWNATSVSSFGAMRGKEILLADEKGKLGTFTTYELGVDGGTPVVGKWDTKADAVAVHKGIDVHVYNKSGTEVSMFAYGNPGDQLFAGDWDGDGVDGPGVRRGNYIYLRNSATTGIAEMPRFPIGNDDDELLVGDFNGDGKDDIAVRDGDKVTIRTELTEDGEETEEQLLSSESRLLVGDFDGDGTDEITELNSEVNDVLTEPINIHGASESKPAPNEGDGTTFPSEPTESATDEPTNEPSDEPSESATDEATDEPSESPTDEATDEPSESPTDEATDEPSESPTDEATDEPSESPTDEATDEATDEPSESPTDEATDEATDEPSESATDEPSESPTGEATDEATDEPSESPTDEPSESPTDEASPAVPSTEQVVGEDIDAGIYRLSSDPEDCSLSILYKDGKTQSGRVQGGPRSQVYVSLDDGDALTVTGCDVNAVSKEKPADNAVPTDGEWLVGVDVPAGKYLVSGKETCYTTVLSGTDRDATIEKSVEGTTGELTVEDGELISTAGCEWSQLPE